MGYEIVSNKKEAERLSAQDYYWSTLEVSLPKISGTLRAMGKEITADNYDSYLRRQVSNAVVANVFEAGETDPERGGRPRRQLAKKTLVAKLAKELDLPVLIINWVYNQVFEELNLNEEDKEDRKQFGLVKLENMLAELEYALSQPLTPDDQAKLTAQYKAIMELYLKVSGAMPKSETNNKIVMGNDNSTTIKSEKAQIQQNHHNDLQALAPLLQKFLNK